MQRLTFANLSDSFLQTPSPRCWFTPLAGSILALAACTSNSVSGQAKDPEPLKPAADWVISAPTGTPRPPYAFDPDDEKLLEEVQHSSFLFFWNACDPTSGMVVDRTSVKFASIAGVGFQLAAIPVAVEHHWITREQGQERAERILRTLESSPTNRKAGLFFHFLDGPTANPRNDDVVSTIDSTILFAGMIVAGEYFGGSVREIGDRLVDQADWSFFLNQHPRADEPYLKGFLTLGWKPRDFKKNPTGDGALRPYCWADAGDEQRLVYVLAATPSRTDHTADPAFYYRMRRELGEYPGVEPHMWFPWSGAIFTDFFAHCFIDYASMGPDDPAAHGADRRPRIDWWENSRRAASLHRVKCTENPLHLPTFGPNAWGLSACDAASGYSVPGVFPNRIPTADEVLNVDWSDFKVKDSYGDGTVAPYAAGCTIMFDPKPAISALRYYRTLKKPDGTPVVWREPSPSGGPGEYGFRDSFNLGTGWIAPDYVAIDQGPLLLSIENARTGLVWRLFHAHDAVKTAMGRLGLTPDTGHTKGRSRP